MRFAKSGTLILLFCYTFVHSTSVFATESLPTTIEDAIRQNGGTYGVIDTSNPDSATNFVNTIFDKDLTGSVDAGNVESGTCSNIRIFPNIKIYCVVGKQMESWYQYKGKKGEIVTITISAKNFVPEAKISDMDGRSDFFLNEEKNKNLIFKKTLSYTGDYSIGIMPLDYDETKIGESFTINISSDISHLLPEDKDNLIEGRKYTVAELNENYSTTSRKFITEAYVIGIYTPPPCSADGYCEISEAPNITIADIESSEIKEGAVVNPTARLFTGYNHKFKFELDKKYRFEVSIKNLSNTNSLANEFSLIAVKDMDDSLLIDYKDSLVVPNDVYDVNIEDDPAPPLRVHLENSIFESILNFWARIKSFFS